jgi:hypothetical protein
VAEFGEDYRPAFIEQCLADACRLADLALVAALPT